MTKAEHYRSRFGPRDMGAFFQGEEQWVREGKTFNLPVHSASHSPRILIYTSTITLVTSVGTPIYPTWPGYLTGVRMSVTTAPTSTLTMDILLNGVTMFTAGDTKPNITVGNLFGYKQCTGKTHWSIDDYIQCQITNTGGAVGPCVVTMEYFTDG